jgi:1-acyl-sn-glycerol-3-phosphate acyltransferase
MFGQRFTAAYMTVVRAMVGLIAAVVARFKVVGLDNLPPGGPYVIVTNHLSKVDVGVVLLAFPRQRMRVFAADKWRAHPLFGPILGLSGAIWVRRGEVDRKALREALKALEVGQVLGMAPEGTRSRTGVLQKGRQGPAYLASHAGVPLVPVGIINSDRLQSNLLRLRRTDLRVVIGRPFELPNPGNGPKSKELSACTELIMAHIANLLPERYHGVYAGSPVLSAVRAGEDAWAAACAVVGLEDGPAGAKLTGPANECA